MNRIGEKLGWSIGLFGSFLWVAVMSVVRIFSGAAFTGISGLFIFTVAMLLVYRLAPWRRPDTQYWKLLLPFYVLLIVATVLFILDAGGLSAAGLDGWSLTGMIPLLLPLLFIGGKTWKRNGSAKQ